MRKIYTMLAFMLCTLLTSVTVSATAPSKGTPLKSNSKVSEYSLGPNLILNGDFENFESNGFDNWEDYPEGEEVYLYYNSENLFNYIDEWTQTGNKYNGKTYIGRFEDLQNPDDPDNVIGNLKYYAAERLFEWNSWMNSTCQQLIEVESNAKYLFSYIWQAIVKDVRARDDVRYPVSLWIRIYNSDEIGNVINEVPLYNHEINWDNSKDFFVTPWSKEEDIISIPYNTTYIIVEFGVNGQSGDDNQGASGKNDVQLNISGMSLKKSLSETPAEPDPIVPEPVEKDNYMEGATSGDVGMIGGTDSSLVKNGWQLWHCPYEYDWDYERIYFQTPEDLTEEWPSNIRLENNESYSTPNVFYYNDELFDGNIATFRWDAGGWAQNWYSYPVDLPQAGTYTFSMKAGIFLNYHPNHSINDIAYIQDPGVMVVMTTGIGGSYIDGTTVYNDAYPSRLILQPEKGKYFRLDAGEEGRSDMIDCETEFIVTEPGRYYINILGAYALYTFADFSLSKKASDSEDAEHVKLTVKHSGGIDVHAPVVKGKPATISFNHDEYWQLESLKLNGEDVTADMKGLDYTTPELHENAVLESKLKYIGDLEIGSTTDVFELPDTQVSLSISDNSVKITGLAEGDEVVIYNIAGQILDSHNAVESIERITLGSGVYIIRINNKAVKIIL